MRQGGGILLEMNQNDRGMGALTRTIGGAGLAASAAGGAPLFFLDLSLWPVLLECPQLQPRHDLLLREVSCHVASGLGFSHSPQHCRDIVGRDTYEGQKRDAAV